MGNQDDEENVAPVVGAEPSDMSVGVRTEPAATSKMVMSTRTSRAWISLLPALIVLAVIVVFVFQNSKRVRVSLFTLSGTYPLSVALLGAVILGALMTLALGSARILQLRKRVRRKAKSSVAP